MALEREEGAEQIVGNRDHGKGKGIQTGEAGLKNSRSVRREGVCAGDGVGELIWGLGRQQYRGGRARSWSVESTGELRSNKV